MKSSPSRPLANTAFARASPFRADVSGAGHDLCGIPSQFAYPAAFGDSSGPHGAFEYTASRMGDQCGKDRLISWRPARWRQCMPRPPYMGPAYWIPAFWVPALLATHEIT